MKSDTVAPGEVSADLPATEAVADRDKAVEENVAARETVSATVDLGKKPDADASAERATTGPADSGAADSGAAADAGSVVGDGDGGRAGTGFGGPVLTAVLAVLVAGLVAVVAVLGWQVKQHSDIEAAGRAAKEAAENYAIALTSIDSQNLDEDFAAVLDGATGEFKDMYGQSSAQLKQLLIDNNATGEGTVIDSAIKSASEDRAEILLFVDQTVTNSAAPEPRIDRSRVLMTMEKVDGRWLAAQVDLP